MFLGRPSCRKACQIARIPRFGRNGSKCHSGPLSPCGAQQARTTLALGESIRTKCPPSISHRLIAHDQQF
jgi:hypothetical protein